MKNYRTILLTAAIMLAAACQKAEMNIDGNQEIGQGLVFSASLSGTPESKSYFQNTDGTQHNLVWSGYDCLGIYNYTAALTSAEAQKVNGAKTAAAAIDSEDRTLAKFTAPGENWTKEDVQEYWFYAYYPELGENARTEANGIVSGLSIPDVQTEGFGKYHICSASEPVKVQKEDIGSSPIALNFVPRTALFSVHTYIAAENRDFSTAGLKSIKVTFDGVDKNSNAYYAAGEYSLDLKDGSLSYTGNGSKSITVNTSAYYTTNKLYTAIKEAVETETNVSSTIDIVVLPVDGFTGKVTFEFESLDPTVTIPSVEKSVTNKSFTAGGHYNSKVYINPSSDAPAAEAGYFYYSDGTWSENLDGSKTCIGVIFHAGNVAKDDVKLQARIGTTDSKAHGLVVALKDLEPTVWMKPYAYTQVSKDLNLINGYSNTQLMNAWNADASHSSNKIDIQIKMAAFVSANPAPETSSGWYLPSIKELSTLCSGWRDEIKNDYKAAGVSMRDKVHASFDKIGSGANKMVTSGNTRFYWSSTGYGTATHMAVGFDGGTVRDLTSDDANYARGARMVLAF